MIIREGSGHSPDSKIEFQGKNIVQVFRGDKLVWPPTLSTDIRFEVTIASEDVGSPIPLISLYDNTRGGFYNLSTGDGHSEFNPVLPIDTFTFEDLNGDTVSVDQSPLITHIYNAPGTYTVTVHCAVSITGTKFVNFAGAALDRIRLDVENNPYITKIIKYKSPTITSLSYTFAGLPNCIPADNFILETPNVVQSYATFFKFGSSAWAANAGTSLSAWEFSPNLLSQCTELTSLTGTFYLCKLKKIPMGFFDTLTKVKSCYDTFKRSHLGNWAYVDYTRAEYFTEVVAGESFVPMNLLHHMPLLTVIEGMFNAMDGTTNQRTFGTTGENTTNSLNWGNWCRPSLYLKADFFHNGKEEGNTEGSIVNADFAFSKANLIAVEKDLFRYIRNTIERLEGFLYETNWPLNDTVSQASLFGWSPSADETNYLTNTTLRADRIIGDVSFPNTVKLYSAFTSFSYNRGWYSTYDIWGMSGSGEARTTGITPAQLNVIRALFPVADSNNPPVASPVPTSPVDGLDSIFYNLKIEGYNSLAEAEPDLTAEQWRMVGVKVSQS